MLAERDAKLSARELEIKNGFAELKKLQDPDGRTTRYGDVKIRHAAYAICLKYKITHRFYIAMWCLKKYLDGGPDHPFEKGRAAFLEAPAFECDSPGADDHDAMCFFAGFHFERRKNPKFVVEADAS